MDIRELRYMVTLADARTLSRAAERLHVSRQAVAKTLRQVEKQAPARLFQRDADGITPTEQGAAFVRDAREVLGAFDELCASTWASSQTRTPRPAGTSRTRPSPSRL